MCVRNTAFFKEGINYNTVRRLFSSTSDIQQVFSVTQLHAPAGIRLHVDLSSSGAEMH